VRGHQGKAFDVVTGESEEPREPSKAAAQDQPGCARMRNDARRESKSVLLSGDVNRAEQAASSEAASTSFRVDGHLSHSRQVDDHSIVAGAEARKAMTSAAHGGEHIGRCRCPD